MYKNIKMQVYWEDALGQMNLMAPGKEAREVSMGKERREEGERERKRESEKVCLVTKKERGLGGGGKGEEE